MDISITEFKYRCLEIVRRVEESGEPYPPSTSGTGEPWKLLRSLGGKLAAAPGESAITDEDFESFRCAIG